MHIKVFVINNFRLQRIPSLFINSEKHTFLVNVPELTQRFMKENGVKMTPSTKIIITGPSSDYFLGLPGYLLSSHAREVHCDTKIYGSGRLFDILQAFKFLFGLKFMYFASYGINYGKEDQHQLGVQQSLQKSQFADFQKLVEFFNNWKGDPRELPPALQSQTHSAAALIKPKSKYFSEEELAKHSLKVMAEEDYELIYIPIWNRSKSENAFSLLFVFHDEKVKFDVEKIKSFGLTREMMAQITKLGAATLPSGGVVTQDDIRGTSVATGFFVFDCPSADFVQSIAGNEFIRKVLASSGQFALNYVFHLATVDVALHPEYLQWTWLPELQRQRNVYLSSDFDEEFHRPAQFRYRAFYEAMAVKFPAFFPRFPTIPWDQNASSRLPPTSLFHNSFTNYNIVKAKTEPIPYLAANNKNLSVISSMATDYSHEAYRKHVSQIRVAHPFSSFPFTVILGTGSMAPSTYRNVSAILYAVSEQFFTLLDCGEGTVFQITEQFGSKSDEVILKLQLVAITHLHGDHFFGLLEMIRYRANLAQAKGLSDVPKLMIVVPQNCLTVLLMFVEYSGVQDSLVICTTQELMDHYMGAESAASLRKMVDEEITKGTAATFNYQNPLYLKSLESYRSKFSNGLQHVLAEFQKNGVSKLVPVPVFHCPESVGFVLEAAGKKIVYSGDCQLSKQLIPFGLDCDLLIHECTFDCAQDLRMVDDKNHSNIEHALTIGTGMNAKYTCLTHFSQRFRVLNEGEDFPIHLPTDPTLLSYFQQRAFMAQDHLCFDFNSIALLPEVHLAINHAYTFKQFHCK